MKLSSSIFIGMIIFIALTTIFAGCVSQTPSLPSTIPTVNQLKLGDIATVAFTIYDDQDRPIVTTDAKLYNDTLNKGGTVFYSNPLNVPVDITTTTNVTKIPVVYKQYNTYFGLFRDEMNLISTGLSGMKVNDQKTISLVMPKDPLETQVDADQFTLLVKPAADTRVNEQIVLALTDHPQINLDNSTPVDQYMRTFYVKEISPEGLNMKYGYSKIDIQVISPENQNSPQSITPGVQYDDSTPISTQSNVASSEQNQYRSTPVVTYGSSEQTPSTLSGSGDDVVSFAATGTSLRIFTMKYTGTSNFAVVLKDANGGYMKLLANEIGSYSGKKSEQLSTGKYYLDVTASGPWSIQISS